jgi:hypothetical protein
MAGGIDMPDALDKAFEFIYKPETEGDYSEFGVFQGVSLARSIRADLNCKKETGCHHVRRFVGFDSFEGLPSFVEGDNLNGYRVFQSGQFPDTSQEKVSAELQCEGIPTDNLTLIPGFYSESLLANETTAHLQGVLVAIAHIGCDLHGSPKDCQDFLAGRLADGAVMLFDNWFCYRGRCPDRGVDQAFDEWRQQVPYWIFDYFNYNWAGRVFIMNTKDWFEVFHRSLAMIHREMKC